MEGNILKEKLEIAEKIASVSHDLKSPLTAILGYAELIRARKDLPEDARENADKIVSSAASMLSLIKKELDGEEEGVSSFSLYDMLFELRSETAARIRNKDIELCVSCAKSVPEHFRGDGIDVRRIISNLLSNAAKYTEKGEICLNLSYSEGILTMEVTDTGKGINKEDIPRLFDKNTRFDNFAEGEGLGLYLVKKLIDSYRGNIKVSSEIGKGSIFTAEIFLESI